LKQPLFTNTLSRHPQIDNRLAAVPQFFGEAYGTSRNNIQITARLSMSVKTFIHRQVEFLHHTHNAAALNRGMGAADTKAAKRTVR